MVIFMDKKILNSFIVIFFIISTTGINNLISNAQISSNSIISLSSDSAYPGELITINGNDFGSNPGYVVLTGLKIEPQTWSDNLITFFVPDDAMTGFIYVRDSSDTASNRVTFTVNRDLDDGQILPYNLEISDTGLLGAAFLVETDGEYIYGITGFETLSTFKIHDSEPYTLKSRIYLPQRVGDLKLCNGYLFCSGDHGLFVYKTSDLQQANPKITAGISGDHYLSVDAKMKTLDSIDNTIIALCSYQPSLDTQELNMVLYSFENEELGKLGTYTRSAVSTERQHAIVIDPVNPKVYVSGGETLLGDDKYILEISIDDPSTPVLNYKEDTGELLPFDMETIDGILWTGVVKTGTEIFRTYTLNPDSNHLILDKIITGSYNLGRTTRVKILNDKITIGCAWLGNRPDLFLFNTYPSTTTAIASYNSIDWAFDISGYAESDNDGKIIIADEWGGFLTYEYSTDPTPSISHELDYNWAPASAMTENIHLTDDRVYIANRGAGVWSADRYDLSDHTSWKFPDWEWTSEEPQPYPVSGLATREDPTHGLLIAALGHDKAMAWGTEIYGILYKETSTKIQRLAISDPIDPPGLYSSGECVVWPETDLVFLTTGSDGIRAYIVNPDAPSITIHNDCLSSGFATDVFSTANMASCMKYYTDGSTHKLIVGSIPGLLVSDPTIHIFNINYPEGIPDRNNPDRPIEITLESQLDCTQYKTVNYLDITSDGLIAIATSQGIGLFNIEWIPQLNELSINDAWNKIKIPTDSFEPYWDDTWSMQMKDVGLKDDNTLYCVKSPEGKNPGGIWKIDFEINEETLSHSSAANGYYPGVQCGMDYTQFLQGWANPDIVTIHHPYALAVDENGLYVTGWSGKLQRITESSENQPPSTPTITGPSSGIIGELYTYTANSIDPDGDHIQYYFDWGDGTNSDWQESSSASHSWNIVQTYNIRVKAKDENDAVSGWGSMSISIPKTKTNVFIFYQILQKILEIFQNKNSILRYYFY